MTKFSAQLDLITVQVERSSPNLITAQVKFRKNEDAHGQE